MYLVLISLSTNLVKQLEQITKHPPGEKRCEFKSHCGLIFYYCSWYILSLDDEEIFNPSCDKKSTKIRKKNENTDQNYYCYCFTLLRFFTSALADSFSPEFEWQRVTSALFCSLAYFNDAVVWMVSTCPLISKSSSPCTTLLVTALSTPITIGITITFMFPSFFSSLARSRYLSLFSLSFSFTLWSAGMAKFTTRQVRFFLLTITRFGCLAEIKWSIFISKSQRSFCISIIIFYCCCCC